MSGALAITPLAAEEFARWMAGFALASSPIAIAVSGGPDSMALAFCVHRWNQRPVVALIVDHGLRAESAAEAAQVKIRLEQIGLRAEILAWQHDPLTARLHEQARAARYRLLSEACHRHGVRDLLLAHHQDDQAETVLMRLAKGSGIDGLAGIAAQSYRDDIRLLRPFLSVPKARLIATCRAAALDVVTDPSNLSEKFARGRLRRLSPLLSAEGLTTENLIALSQNAAEAKDALDHYTKLFLTTAAHVERGGSVRLDRADLAQQPRAIALRAVLACLRYVHEGKHPPEQAALAHLLDALIHAPSTTARTLHGCIASIAENRITFLREPEAVHETTPLFGGQTVLWDDRWLVTMHDSLHESVVIRALGSQPNEIIDRLAPTLRHDIPQGRVRASLPAIWRGQNLQAIPAFDARAVFSLHYRKRTFP